MMRRLGIATIEGDAIRWERVYRGLDEWPTAAD
jgi:hypothetical protein